MIVEPQPHEWGSTYLIGFIWWCEDEVCDCTQPVIERIGPGKHKPWITREKVWEGRFHSQAEPDEREAQRLALIEAATNWDGPVEVQASVLKSDIESGGRVKTVYVVQGQTGEYSDHDEWLVGFYFTEDAAKAAVDAFTRAYRSLLAGDDSYDKRDAIVKPMRTIDPYFCVDYTGTTYSYYEVAQGLEAPDIDAKLAEVLKDGAGA